MPLFNSRPVLPTTTLLPNRPPRVGVTPIALPNLSTIEKLVVCCSASYRSGNACLAVALAKADGAEVDVLPSGVPGCGYALAFAMSINALREAAYGFASNPAAGTVTNFGSATYR